MSNLVIVAIPAADDRVWKVSSEKVPHLTLLHLGDADVVPNLDRVMQFVEHSITVCEHGPFMLSVDYRDTLGKDEADVLFFEKGWDIKWIDQFRHQLLQNGTIATAFQASEQFMRDGGEGGPDQYQEWIPHLTLGYPNSPAKELKDDESGIHWVTFDRIAVWTGDYEGPEWRLKWPQADMADVGYGNGLWSGMQVEAKPALEEAIEHYGVKGMKWGVTKDTKRPGTGLFEPAGKSKGEDIFKAVVWPAFPPLGIFAIPAQVRLIRGGARGIKSKAIDIDEKRFAAKAQSQKNFVEVNNKASDRINRDLDPINKKYSEADLAKPAKRKQYDAEVTKLLQDSYQEAANSIGNRANTMKLNLEFRNDGLDFVIKATDGPPKPMAERIKHADDVEEEPVFEVDLEVVGKLTRDPSGHILGVDFSHYANEAKHAAMEMGEEYLEHYGVKGMKWGVRKEEFVTRQHQKALATESKRREKRPAQDIRALPTIGVSKRTKASVETKGGVDHPPTEDAIKVAVAKQKLRKSGTAALSNKELQELQRRLNLENDVERLMRGNKTAGQLFVDGVLGRGTDNERKTFENKAGRQTRDFVTAKAAGPAVAIATRAIRKR